jgi:hypothetical protein
MGFVQNLFPQRYTDALCMLAAYKDVDELRNFFDDEMDIDRPSFLFETWGFFLSG